MITIGEIKKKIITLLNDNNILDSQFEAISMISFSLGINNQKAIIENDLEISNAENKTINKLLEKRINGYPLAYLINEKHFFNRDFILWNSF